MIIKTRARYGQGRLAGPMPVVAMKQCFTHSLTDSYVSFRPHDGIVGSASLLSVQLSMWNIHSLRPSDAYMRP